MSFTEKQKAYHLAVQNEENGHQQLGWIGHISREDFELMGKKLAKHSGMTEEQAEATTREFLKVADMINLKPGVKTHVHTWPDIVLTS